MPKRSAMTCFSESLRTLMQHQSLLLHYCDVITEHDSNDLLSDEDDNLLKLCAISGRAGAITYDVVMGYVHQTFDVAPDDAEQFAARVFAAMQHLSRVTGLPISVDSSSDRKPAKKRKRGKRAKKRGRKSGPSSSVKNNPASAAAPSSTSLQQNDSTQNHGLSEDIAKALKHGRSVKLREFYGGREQTSDGNARARARLEQAFADGRTLPEASAFVAEQYNVSVVGTQLQKWANLFGVTVTPRRRGCRPVAATSGNGFDPEHDLAWIGNYTQLTPRQRAGLRHLALQHEAASAKELFQTLDQDGIRISDSAKALARHQVIHDSLPALYHDIKSQLLE